MQFVTEKTSRATHKFNRMNSIMRCKWGKDEMWVNKKKQDEDYA